jgi:hypothetical protein
MANTSIESINGDNRRPEMPADHTALVRYSLSPRFGWLCCRTFKTMAEAEAFALGHSEAMAGKF